MHKQLLRRTSGLYFLLASLGLVFVLVFFIFRPFLYSLIFAAVFATAFYPMYQVIMKATRDCSRISALSTVLIVAVVIFTPITFLGIELFKEVHGIYMKLVVDGDGVAGLNMLNAAQATLHRYFPMAPDFSLNVDQSLKKGLVWIFEHLGVLSGNFAKLGVSFFLFFVAFYYLLKDGHHLRAYVVELSPLPDTDDETILKKLELAVNSVLKGSLSVALIQGVLTSIGFYLFGVDAVLLGGCLAAVAALIPGLGTSLVLGPTILYLFIKGNILAGIGLTVWAMGAVGLVDNILGPILIGRGAQLHPLIILLSVLGGIVFFGPIGFLLGPLSMSLLFALLAVYTSLKAR
jgi:predicted PurR-regulated permease PerM